MYYICYTRINKANYLQEMSKNIKNIFDKILLTTPPPQFNNTPKITQDDSKFLAMYDKIYVNIISINYYLTIT